MKIQKFEKVYNIQIFKQEPFNYKYDLVVIQLLPQQKYLENLTFYFICRN
jgi:hypothetical protein